MKALKILGKIVLPPVTSYLIVIIVSYFFNESYTAFAVWMLITIAGWLFAFCSKSLCDALDDNIPELK